MKPFVSIVTGTYNRLPHMQKMVNSVRRSVGRGIPYEIVLVDGGSTDGTVTWCKAQSDIVLIEQGELLGAVKAFNTGFEAARGKYVIIANDDVEFVDESILRAIVYMEGRKDVGVGCFYQDRGGMDWHVENMPVVHGNNQAMQPYGQVCIVPRWLGDRVGWWGDYLHTYGGDNELSCNVLELGFKVEPIKCACIHDFRIDDQLRKINNDDPREIAKKGGAHPDSAAWIEKWTRDGGLVGPKVRRSPQVKLPGDEMKLRAFYAPIYEPGHTVQKSTKRGLRDALSRVGLVYEYDYQTVNEEKGRRYCVNYAYDIVEAWKPNLLVFQLHDYSIFSPDAIAELRNIVPHSTFVNWNGDYHPEQLYDQTYILLMRQFHAAGFVTTSVKDVYDSMGVDWFYWQIGYEEVDEDNLPSVATHDVVFLANGYSKARIGLAKQLRKLDCNVGIYGSWGRPIIPDGYNLYDFATGHALYQNAKIAISDSQWPNAAGFVSNRLFQALYAGVLLFQQRFDGMEELLGLRHETHLIVWDNPSDLPGLIKEWLANEKQRKRVAKKGREFVMRNHSFDARVQEMLRAIK